MLKHIRERVADLFRDKDTPPAITENSTLSEIATHYPHAFKFIERKYGIKLAPGDSALALKTFTERHALPPSQIVFMEVQMASRVRGVKQVSAAQAKKLLDESSLARVLDVRESWELNHGSLPKSLPLSPKLLDEVLTEWPKETPILVYCHFGVRSLDAAAFLADRGFTDVRTLKGGIDAWAIEIDPSLKRYEAAWC